jgi:hypothetical protein
MSHESDLAGITVIRYKNHDIGDIVPRINLDERYMDETYKVVELCAYSVVCSTSFIYVFSASPYFAHKCHELKWAHKHMAWKSNTLICSIEGEKNKWKVVEIHDEHIVICDIIGLKDTMSISYHHGNSVFVVKTEEQESMTEEPVKYYHLAKLNKADIGDRCVYYFSDEVMVNHAHKQRMGVVYTSTGEVVAYSRDNEKFFIVKTNDVTTNVFWSVDKISTAKFDITKPPYADDILYLDLFSQLLSAQAINQLQIAPGEFIPARAEIDDTTCYVKVWSMVRSYFNDMETVICSILNETFATPKDRKKYIPKLACDTVIDTRLFAAQFNVVNLALLRTVKSRLDVCALSEEYCLSAFEYDDNPIVDEFKNDKCKYKIYTDEEKEYLECMWNGDCWYTMASNVYAADFHRLTSTKHSLYLVANKVCIVDGMPRPKVVRIKFLW